MGIWSDLSGGGSGSGDVTGPASSTDNAIARFDGTSGKTLQNSSATLDDSGVLVTAELQLTTALDETYGGTGQTTFTTGDILYASGANTLSKLAVGSDDEVLTLASGVPSWAAASGGGGWTWSEVTGTSQSMAVDNAYIANNASLVTLTLPTTAAIGERVKIVGKGSGLYKIAQNASETIYFPGGSTTTGTGGSLTCLQNYVSITLVCITANNDWVISEQQGSFEVV